MGKRTSVDMTFVFLFGLDLFQALDWFSFHFNLLESMQKTFVMAPQCKIDRDTLNENTLPMMRDIALSFFASACGKNRGAWVLDPPDGNTYSCLSFPSTFSKLAGLDLDPSLSSALVDANSINQLYLAGNLTALQTVDLLDFLVQRVYQSSADTDTSPYACDFNGLAGLVDDDDNVSDSSVPFDLPIRAVGLAGLFVPAPWATKGEQLSIEEAKSAYNYTDFQQMATLGINTVQIAIPVTPFVSDDGSDLQEALEDLLSQIEDAGLRAILELETVASEPVAVTEATAFAANQTAVAAVTIPTSEKHNLFAIVSAIRVKAPLLPLFVPINGADLLTLQSSDPLVFGALEMTHTSTVADIASSTSKEDRSKMFYHESIACIQRAPIEYTKVYRGMPTMLASGFNIAIDDCVLYNTTEFKDYGQCDRFEETLESDWWFDHRRSFAARQLSSYEQGLGWTFSTWKLLPDDDDEFSVGVIDKPGKLMALKNVVAAGIFPNLHTSDTASQACLNPPVNDFILGDDTLAPTMAPPPDCGNGWWNFTTEKCDFWIPPTPSPTPEVLCPGESHDPRATPPPGLRGFVSGAFIGAVVAVVILKCCAVIPNRQRGYEEVQN